MLRFLRIRDFALIRNLEIEFGDGLTVLTGETGSGKSIIVDAFGLLVGARSSQDMVRTNCDTAVLEGVFSVEDGSVAEQLTPAGIDGDEDSILIRREISTSGRGRVFINNSLATLSLLKSIGGALADIHGQQEHETLLDLSTHLTWLDRFGSNETAAHELRLLYTQMRETARRLDALAMDEQERQRLLDILRFQVDEIQRANIRPGEKAELENERSVLANREKVFALANEAYALLYESEHAITGQVDRLTRVIQQLAEYDSGWTTYLESLRESLYRLEDLAYAARDYTGSIDFSPERLDQVERRLSDLDRLSAKYGKSMEEVLTFGDQCNKRLEELVSSSDTSIRLSEELDILLKRFLELAERLSSKRRKDGARLEREIRNEFHALAMGKMDLSVRFRPRERPGSVSQGHIPACCGPGGVDQVEFLLAPNEGEEIRPLAKIASGGELSRIMLSIKALCGGGEKGKTLVFDEIDAGIGGRVAEAVGKRLREVSVHNQVLCVTHLPQIAAYAQDHFNVRKDIVGARTETFVERLDRAARVGELARMMGGEVITETTRRHAQEMLDHAGKETGRESRA
ncbi:MAG: DNA repair protein RecN [Acidobacteriota bacterium]|jgi:DNA repair protein RecN (Recombination protein N)